MRVSSGSTTKATMPPDPLERLLEAEASLADEYERAQEDASRTLGDAHARAEIIVRAARERCEAERARIARGLEQERAAALATVAAETQAGVARYDLPVPRVEALAADAVNALFDELLRETGA